MNSLNINNSNFSQTMLDLPLSDIIAPSNEGSPTEDMERIASQSLSSPNSFRPSIFLASPTATPRSYSVYNNRISSPSLELESENSGISPSQNDSVILSPLSVSTDSFSSPVSQNLNSSRSFSSPFQNN